MLYQLELKHEELQYTGNYARPVLELWGYGGVIIKGILEALAPHGVTFQQIQANSSTNVAETGITAQIPNVGPLRFGFDKLEFKFTNFSQGFFESIPKTMAQLVGWMAGSVPDFKFASHRFLYSAHSFLKDSTPEEVLEAMDARELKSAGINVGSGAIFNYVVPSKSWETHLLVDRSRHTIGGIFISFELLVHTSEIDYAQMVLDGRKYLADALAELNIAMPEAVSA